MRLTKVAAHALSSPIEPPQDRSFHGGTRRLRKRDFVVVIVTLADGTRGIAPAGASSSAMREFFEGASQADFAATVRETVGPALEGAEIDRPQEVHEHLESVSVPDRIRTEAASALDVALWDAWGRKRGMSVATLLAEEYEVTATQGELPLYASAGMYMPPDGYVEQARAVSACDFSGYKYRPGIGPDGDRETVERLREAVPDLPLMLDCHTWWKGADPYPRETVSALVEQAAEADVTWVEEPVEPTDYDGYLHLAGRGVDLAGGESEPDSDGLLALADTGAIGYLQGDVRHHEGFTGCWRAIEACVDRPVTFVPHNFGTWLGLVANAHLISAAPEAELVEYPVFEDDPALAADPDPGMYPYPLAFEVINETPAIRDGTLTVPDGPGLGVTLNEAVLEEYPFKEGAWTTFETEES